MSAPRTAFLLHPAASLHDTGWRHPEHQGRLRSLASTVGKDMMALHGRVEQTMSPGEATEEDFRRVHTAEHVDRVRAACREAAEEEAVVKFDLETMVSGGSWEALTGSVGAALTAARSVARGEHRNAFVATRPPGHHASANRAMGFCLFNTVAIVARTLQEEGLAERILIVDWDVHHGNGTQEIFWEDPSVFYLSLHQAPFFPGTGMREERGGGAGEGTTMNVPLPAGMDGEGFRTELERALEAVEESFDFDLILVSAGYDALAGDPLGGMLLEPEDFHRLTRTVVATAERRCEGRIVACLEGGYEPRRTGLATVATVRALAGIEESDPTVLATG